MYFYARMKNVQRFRLLCTVSRISTSVDWRKNEPEAESGIGACAATDLHPADSVSFVYARIRQNLSPDHAFRAACFVLSTDLCDDFAAYFMIPLFDAHPHQSHVLVTAWNKCLTMYSRFCLARAPVLLRGVFFCLS